jgi:hypothetical protein
MNIKPEFRTSIEWKKYRQKLKHPAAMEFLVNLGCELEGITRQKKQDTGHLGTDDLEDLALMAGVDQYEGIEAARLEDSLLTSGLMTSDDGGYRFIFWEEHNTNLISSRQNGRKGGRKKNENECNSTQPNEEKNIIEDNENEPKYREQNSKVNEPNKTESNLSERNITGGLTQEEPTVNRGLSVDEVSKKLLEKEAGGFQRIGGHYGWED